MNDRPSGGTPLANVLAACACLTAAFAHFYMLGVLLRRHLPARNDERFPEAAP